MDLKQYINNNITIEDKDYNFDYYYDYEEGYIISIVKELTIENLYTNNNLLRYQYSYMNNLLEEIKDSEHNYDSMNFISTLIYYICNYDTNSEYRNYRFRTFFNKIKILNKNHYVCDANFINTENFLIIKYASGYSSAEELLTEYIIGKVLNNLRKDIPNFMFTFSINFCTEITEYVTYVNNKFEDVKNKIPLLCRFNNEYYNNTERGKGFVNNGESIIIEKVKGVTLFKFIETCTGQEFFDIIIQLFLALSYAYDKYKFTHNDLHLGNILIDKRNYELTYKYKFEGKDYYLTTNILVTIIDYGRSYIYYNETSFLRNFTEEEQKLYNIINKPFILHDIVTFLYSCTIIDKDKYKYNNFKMFIKDILNIFYTNDYIKNNKETFRDIRHNIELSKITYDQIIKIIIDIGTGNKYKFKLPITTKIKINNVSCTIVNKINLLINRDVIQFNDCINFYDFYNTNKNELSIINGKIYFQSNFKIEFDFINIIKHDLGLLKNFVRKFINFIKAVCKFSKEQIIIKSNNKTIVNLDKFIIEYVTVKERKITDFINNFIRDNFYMIKCIIDTLFKLLDINTELFKNIIQDDINTELFNITNEINSLSK